MKVGHIGPHLEQQRLGLFDISLFVAVWIESEVVEGSRDHLVGRVEESDAAAREFRHVFRFEDGRPGVNLVDPQHRLDFVDVVADAVGSPQIGHRVLMTRIHLVELLEQHGIQIGHVGQQGFVQLLERSRLYLFGQEIIGRHHQIVTGPPRQQLAFQGFVGVKHVIDGLDPGRLLEIAEGGLADIV